MSANAENGDGGATADHGALPSTSNHSTGTISGAKSAAQNPKKFACVLCRRRKLKCDGAKPACATCARLKHNCSYQDDGPKKPPIKRRNIKDLEARLAQIEGKLTAERAKVRANANGNPIPAKEPNVNIEWNDIDGDMDWNAENCPTADDANTWNGSFAPDAFYGDFFDVLPLGLQESLPPQDLMDELNRLYFEKLHPLIPMIHQGRFLASLEMPPHMRPAVCLRYAMFAVTCSVADGYQKYKQVFYERARTYAERDELKGLGEAFISIQHAQCWILLNNFEVREGAFPRAWMSCGRAVRLVQMMGLDRLDTDMKLLKQTMAPPRDWTELEERRRTFWGAFTADRWSSAGTGWSMNINEDDVTTNLPTSEHAFIDGVEEEGPSLSSVFTRQGASRLSLYAGIVFCALIFGHNIIHMHRSHPDDKPEDYKNGEFWKRHRRMDNVLSTALFSLPKHMRVVNNPRDPHVVLINVNIHASAICLHQAAVLKAEEHGIDKDVINRSRMRTNVAADEIVNVLRMCVHGDISDLHPWVCFGLYVAAQVFLEGLRRQEDVDDVDQHKMNLEFVLNALNFIRNKHGIVESFLMQLQQDVNSLNIPGLSQMAMADPYAEVGLVGCPYIMLHTSNENSGGPFKYGGIAVVQGFASNTGFAHRNHASPNRSGSSDSPDGLIDSTTPESGSTIESQDPSLLYLYPKMMPLRNQKISREHMAEARPALYPVADQPVPMFPRRDDGARMETLLSHPSSDVYKNSMQNILRRKATGELDLTKGELPSDQSPDSGMNSAQPFDIGNCQFFDASDIPPDFDFANDANFVAMMDSANPPSAL